MTGQPRVGSLFSGYGGLDVGVTSVVGGSVAWHCEIEAAPSKILAHHWPEVPNLGDITRVDWTSVEPVDVLTGGSPCQDVSAAGRRAGMKAGTRSGLWASMVDAIDVLRPRLVVWENVRGVTSAEADSGLEPCTGCVGDGDDGAVLRALGRVLGDLADCGYDARWYGLRAADVGAPHGRFRVFVVATDTRRTDGQRRSSAVPGSLSARRSSGGPEQHQPVTAAHANVAGSQGREPTAGRDLPDRGAATDTNRDPVRLESISELGSGGTSEPGHAIRWGQYESAIRRWERVLGRVAPAPTELAPKGGQRLSPAFVEFMMGLPAGHVTAVPGISRNEQLKALGNGVVPQQAAAAVSFLLTAQLEEKAA